MKYVSIYKLKSVASVALATFALSAFAALPEIPLTSQMAGAVLLDKTIYTVSGTV